MVLHKPFTLVRQNGHADCPDSASVVRIPGNTSSSVAFAVTKSRLRSVQVGKEAGVEPPTTLKFLQE